MSVNAVVQLYYYHPQASLSLTVNPRSSRPLFNLLTRKMPLDSHK